MQKLLKSGFMLRGLLAAAFVVGLTLASVGCAENQGAETAQMEQAKGGAAAGGNCCAGCEKCDPAKCMGKCDPAKCGKDCTCAKKAACCGKCGGDKAKCCGTCGGDKAKCCGKCGGDKAKGGADASKGGGCSAACAKAGCSKACSKACSGKKMKPANVAGVK